MKILLVEDDEGMSQMLEKAFTNQLYLVDIAANGQEGLELAEAFDYDLIVLDLILPKVNGINFCRQRRAQGDTTPVLFLTSQEDSINKVLGLDAGADDYVVKPFNLEELLARMRALLRRGNAAELPVIEWGNLRLDPSRCDVTYGEHSLSLTAKEYALLELFLRSRNRIFSQSTLVEHLWTGVESPSENAVRSHIKGLRRKLKQVGAVDLIETVYGLGYRLKLKSSSEDSVKENSAEPPLVNSQTITKELKDKQTPLDISSIWHKSKQKYQDRIAIIEKGILSLANGLLTTNMRQQVLQETHTLIGSLGSFGFNNASELVRKVQQIFQSEDLNPDCVETLSCLVSSISQELELPIQSPQCQIPRISPSKSVHLLIVEDDIGLAEQIVVDAIGWGIQAEIALDLIQARTAIAQNLPDIVLLDLNFPDTAESGFSLLEELKTFQPPIPVLVFTSRDSFSDRIQVAKLGGRGFIQKPIASAQVIEAITQFLEHVTPPQAKLLIVDDDPQVLELLSMVLEPWGFNLTLLNDPLRFWVVLEQTIPDLLILDLEMSAEIGGIELCQVIRNDLRWQDLPLLVLSSHTDAATIHRVFTAGADDYVTKPIVSAELLARILNRLERSQALRKLAEVDMLTGVANRRKGVQEFNRLLHQAEREQKTLCFVILDIDHFKQINDRHGHETGDRVLAKLGEQLKYSFSSDDIVARWGGEEFVVALYNATESEGVELLQYFLNNFYNYLFLDRQQQAFQVSFSAGVAEFPKHGKDLQSLYQAADRGLFQAKAAGRNRIFAAPIEEG